MPKWRAHSTAKSATDVRELVSSATVRTRSIGTLVKTATDATGPSEPMAMPGTHDVVVAAQVLDRRDEPEVDLARVQQAAQRAGTSKRTSKRSACRLEPVDERPRVEVLDRAEAEPAHAPTRR